LHGANLASPARNIVAFLATDADFFAIAQFVAVHQIRASKAPKKLYGNRGIPMTKFVTHFASAVAAAFISGAVLSLAIY
jgi:hypothetical protein